MKTKIRLSLIACATAIVCFGATSAFAGEITGNGKPITVNGKSICAYSGQQDDAAADAGYFAGDRVQNWGQVIVAVLRGILDAPWAPAPGTSCRGGGPASD
jgi:hypothetical protein